MPSSTKWRLLITAASGSNPGLTKLEMHTSIGGADVCTGGTASASSQVSSTYDASMAFDGSASTYWYASAPTPQTIQYDFASPQDIVEFAITAPPGNDVCGAPQDFQFQYWNGSAWVTTINRAYEGFTAGQRRVYSTSYPTAAKQAWRLLISAVQTENPGVAEAQMRSAAGGANLCTGGTPFGVGAFNSSYTPAAAFDGNTATYWYSNQPSPQYIGYQFSSAVDIVQYSITAPGGGDQTHAPKSFKLQYNDGNGGWVDADSRSGLPNWTAGEARVFSFGAAAPPDNCYWRILVTASYGSTWNQLGCEVEWLNAIAADQSYAGIPIITSGDESGLNSANLYDNNFTTFHQWVGGSPLPLYSGVFFSTATSTPDLRAITMKSHADWASRMPKTFTVQKSSDGFSWTDVLTVTNTPAWGASEKRTFDFGIVSVSARPQVFVCT